MYSEPNVPRMGSLLQPKESLVEMTNKLWVGGILETRWLYTIDCLLQGVVKKSILHIKLVNRPLTREGQREHCPHSSWLHNQAESLTEIYARTLGETPKNPTSLVPLKRPVSGELVLEDSLARHHVSL